MYLTTAPKILRWFMPEVLHWEIPEARNSVYLTFDDGPVPGVTEQVLDVLDRYNAKATFFCVGDNVRKHPDIYSKIVEAGHTTGNHTFHHLNGWKTGTEEYIRDVRLCSEYVHSKLFRPPYGRITRQQVKILSKDYQIVMWSVLSGDFDPQATPEKCYENITRSAKSGSVIVMHDQQKSAKTMLATLPQVLQFYFEKGFLFKEIKF